jgi:hypothetical protein
LWLAVFAAGVVLLFLAAAAAFVLLPRGLRSRVVATALPVPPPAEITLTVEHPLKTGTLRVYVDDEMELEQALESRVVQRILSVELRKGWLEKKVYVKPGERTIRVEVEGETFQTARRISARFDSGEKRRLHAQVTSLLKREITLYWRQ